MPPQPPPTGYCILMREFPYSPHDLIWEELLPHDGRLENNSCSKEEVETQIALLFAGVVKRGEWVSAGQHGSAGKGNFSQA